MSGPYLYHENDFFSKCLSVIVYYTEDRRWMKTALSLSVQHGLLDLLQYLVDTVGVPLTGELN